MRALRAAVSLATAALLAGASHAQQPPLRTYTVDDGLGQQTVNRIVQDPLGFLWFGTREGLSRFDGRRFVTYGSERGLPHPNVYDLLLARDGTYWVATGAGPRRFDPAGGARLFAPPDAGAEMDWTFTLVEDQAGVLWAGAQTGLFRLEERGGTRAWRSVELPSKRPGLPVVLKLFEDSRGRLWVSTLEHGLCLRHPDGWADCYDTVPGHPGSGARALAEDASGTVWAGTGVGLVELVAEPTPGGRIVRRMYTEADGLPPGWIQALYVSPDGRLWVGSDQLSEVITEQGTRRLQKFDGINPGSVLAMAEDLDGNLWLGTQLQGATKIARGGFVSYSRPEGLKYAAVSSMFEDQAGDLIVVTGVPWAARFDGKRFVATRLPYAADVDYFGWGWNQWVLQDRQGGWWLPSGRGLLRFGPARGIAELGGRSPLAVYTTRDGLADDNIFRIFEDARGDVWIGTVNTGSLSRWERATGRIRTYSAADGLPARSAPTAFREDHEGTLWIGFYHGGIARYRLGRFEYFGRAEGLPGGLVQDLWADSQGRLWAAVNPGGVVRIDEPAARHLRFRVYTRADGLSSDRARGLTEDSSGRIWITTPRGVDRLDPESGELRAFTTADGLAGTETTIVFRDRRGAIWIGTDRGVSRIDPEPDALVQPPPIRIMGLSLGGLPHPVSEVGATSLPHLELAAGRRSIQAEFASMSFATGEVIRYQYKLEGVDEDWSTPADERLVRYATLGPGRYRLLARAVRANGLASASPAEVSFTVLPPVWRRGWFLALLAASAALGAFAAHRVRLRRLVGLERVRTRIASDLHDDLGSSLSRISILSELLCRDVNGSLPEAAGKATDIAEAARRLVDASGDMIWSIDPRRDGLDHLVARVRELAGEVLDPCGIEWTFEASEQTGLTLHPEHRRHVFLVFKEALHNVVRHAGSRRVRLRLVRDGRWLRAEVADDGCGFDAGRVARAPAGRGGCGLPSLRARAAEMKGTLEIRSAPGEGTRLSLTVPLWKGRGRIGRAAPATQVRVHSPGRAWTCIDGRRFVAGSRSSWWR